jgi:hypothetical protein
MKTLLATLTLLSLAAGPAFAGANTYVPLTNVPHPTYVPQLGPFGGADTNRESQIRALGN